MSTPGELWLRAMGLALLALLGLIAAGVIVWSIDYGAIIVTLTVGYIVFVIHFKEWLEDNDSKD